MHEQKYKELASNLNWIPQVSQFPSFPDFCSDSSWGGGGGTIYSTGFFFVQSILADRYIHRTELRLVSLESLSSVEYGIKKFFWFSFLTGRYRGLTFRENGVNSVDFIHLFSELLTKISPILMKFNLIFHENVVVDFAFEEKINCRLFSLNFFCHKLWLKIHKNQTFSSKTARNKFL